VGGGVCVVLVPENAPDGRTHRRNNPEVVRAGGERYARICSRAARGQKTALALRDCYKKLYACVNHFVLLFLCALKVT